MPTASGKSKKRSASARDDAVTEDTGTPAKLRRMGDKPVASEEPMDSTTPKAAKGRYAIKKKIFTRPRESPSHPDEEENHSIPPPFVVPANCNIIPTKYNSLSELVKSTLKASLAQGEFAIKNQSSGITVRVSDRAAYIKAESCLLKTDIKYFTYETYTDGVKLQKYVIYDLGDVDIAELIDDLKEYGLDPVDVRKMTIKRPRYQGQSNYIAYFDAADRLTLPMVSAAAHICNTVVKWAHYKEPTARIRQCANCFKFGHSDKKCHLPTVCLFCAKSHKAPDCPLLKKKVATGADSIPSYLLKCAGCDKEHTAIYQFCEKRTKYADNLNKGPRGASTSAPASSRGPTSASTTKPTTTTPAPRPHRSNNRRPVQRSHSPPRNTAARVTKTRPRTPTAAQTTKLSFDQQQNRQVINEKPSKQTNNTIISSTNTNSHSKSQQSITNNTADSNSDVFSPQELLGIFHEMTSTISNCRTKKEQLDALMSLALKYMPCRE